MSGLILATDAAAEWSARARRLTPGGVHSPVRAFRSVGLPPLVIDRAAGARVIDVEGRSFIDWIGAWGPALLGHAPAGVVAAVQQAATQGLGFGLAAPAELTLVERIAERVPGAERVRLLVTGTEATMTAVRLARAATGRPLILKFAGGYHGHADSFLVSAGSGAATYGVPDSPGVLDEVARATLVAEFNDAAAVEAVFASQGDRIAAVIVEPVVGNMGCVPPEPGFLQYLRAITARHGAVLILDEVMSGFRVARGGAAERYGVVPDLVTLGKIVGGGMPLSALAGRADLVGLLAPEGPVYQAGTYAAHPLAVAAGLAMFAEIDARPDLYDTLEQRGAVLQQGLERAASRAGVPVRVQRVASMWTVFFTDRPVRGWADAAHVDRERFARFFRGMFERGVLLPPSPFESAFVSLAHGEAEIDATVQAAEAAFLEVAR